MVLSKTMCNVEEKSGEENNRCNGQHKLNVKVNINESTNIYGNIFIVQYPFARYKFLYGNYPFKEHFIFLFLGFTVSKTQYY